MSNEIPQALSELDRMRVERQDAILARIAAQEQAFQIQAALLAEEKKQELANQAALRAEILERYGIGQSDRVLPSGEIQRGANSAAS